MSAIIVRYETRPESTMDNQRLIEKVFAELHGTDPGGIRYASFRDGAAFTHVAITEGAGNPLRDNAAFAEFQRDIAARCLTQPEAVSVTVIGSYGF
jgi:hypothetical protein